MYHQTEEQIEEARRFLEQLDKDAASVVEGIRKQLYNALLVGTFPGPIAFLYGQTNKGVGTIDLELFNGKHIRIVITDTTPELD